MKLRPLSDRVVVKIKPKEEKSSGGIILPEDSSDKSQIGSVIAVGTGRKDASGNTIAMDVAVNDIVYFGKYVGTEYDKDYLIIRENEILGVIKK